MKGLGIAAQWRNRKPIVRFVLLDDGSDPPGLVNMRTHTGGQEDLPLVLVEVMRDTRALLEEYAPDGVVIREPDRPPGPVNRQNTRNAGLSDGILIALAREATPSAFLLSGRDIGRVCGSNKNAVETLGGQITGTPDYARAAAAALAALAHVKSS